MSRLAVAFFLIAVFCVTFSVRAKQNDEPMARISNVQAVSLVRTVVETILREHIDPPTRQQMVVEITRILDSYLENPEPIDLTSSISDAKGPDEVYGVLLSELSKSNNSNIPEIRVLGALEKAVGGMVLGGLEFESRKNALASEQVAANRYVGIGVVLANYPKKGIQFTNVIEDGPASEGGIVAMDLLDTVDGQSTKDRSIGEVVEWLRGPANTVVKVTVRSKDEPAREISLVRRVVPLKSMELVEMNIDKRAILIRIDRFSASSINELENVVARAEKQGAKMDTIVLDMQNTDVDNLHYFHLFADGILDATNLCQVKTRKGLRALKTEDGKAIGERQVAILFKPGQSEAIDLFAKSQVSANGNAFYWFSDPYEKPTPPLPEYSLCDSIELPGTEYFIKTAICRLLDTKAIVVSPDPLEHWRVKPVRGINAKALIKKEGSVLNRILHESSEFSATNRAQKP